MSQGQLSEVEELFCGAERGRHGRQGVRGESCRQRWWAHCVASAVVGCGREQGDRAGWSWRGLVLISCLQGQSCARMFMCMYVPLVLFVVMLSKAHLTSHSRMSGSRSVITPS